MHRVELRQWPLNLWKSLWSAVMTNRCRDVWWVPACPSFSSFPVRQLFPTFNAVHQRPREVRGTRSSQLPTDLFMSAPHVITSIVEIHGFSDWLAGDTHDPLMSISRLSCPHSSHNCERSDSLKIKKNLLPWALPGCILGWAAAAGVVVVCVKAKARSPIISFSVYHIRWGTG